PARSNAMLVPSLEVTVSMILPSLEGKLSVAVPARPVRARTPRRNCRGIRAPPQTPGSRARAGGCRFSVNAGTPALAVLPHGERHRPVSPTRAGAFGAPGTAVRCGGLAPQDLA